MEISRSIILVLKHWCHVAFLFERSSRISVPQTYSMADENFVLLEALNYSLRPDWKTSLRWTFYPNLDQVEEFSLATLEVTIALAFEHPRKGHHDHVAISHHCWKLWNIWWKICYTNTHGSMAGRDRNKGKGTRITATQPIDGRAKSRKQNRVEEKRNSG